MSDQMQVCKRCERRRLPGEAGWIVGARGEDLCGRCYKELTKTNIEQIARVCHEANRAWCEANGDFSHLPWRHVSSSQHDSFVKGVQVSLDGATPEQQHEAWCRDKIDADWVEGPIKDFSAKTHPCLVPYDQLSPEQQAKDHLFVAIVRALSA